MPRSRARRTSAGPSSSVRVPHQEVPRTQPPKPIADTVTGVEPRLRFCMVSRLWAPVRARRRRAPAYASRVERTVGHLDSAALDAGLEHIRRSPADRGVVELIVRRPAVDERETLDKGTLTHEEGLAGDTWRLRGSQRTPDGAAHPDMQLNVINARVSALVAVDPDRRQLAGEQLHLGCAKFSQRFGLDALRFVNSAVGRELRLRGANARVVVPGTVRRGDVVRKLPTA